MAAARTAIESVISPRTIYPQSKVDDILAQPRDNPVNRGRDVLQASGGRGEHRARIGPEQCDRDDADDGDEGQHEAVLDHRGALFTLDETLGGDDELGHRNISTFLNQVWPERRRSPADPLVPASNKIQRPA